MCGNTEHEEYIQDATGNMQKKYYCPIATFISETSSLNTPVPNSSNFARLYGYNSLFVTAAFPAFVEKGYGKLWSSEENSKFFREIISICENHAIEQAISTNDVKDTSS